MASEEAISAVRRSSQIQKEKIEVCCSPHSKCRRSDFFFFFYSVFVLGESYLSIHCILVCFV